MSKDYLVFHSDNSTISKESQVLVLEEIIKNFYTISNRLNKEISILLEETYKKVSMYEDLKTYKKKMPPFFGKPLKWMIKHPIHSIFLFLATSIGGSILLISGGSALLTACVSFTFVAVGGSAMFHLSKKNNIKNDIRSDRKEKNEQVEKLETNLKEKRKEIQNLIENLEKEKANSKKIELLKENLFANLKSYLKLIDSLNERKNKINKVAKEIKEKKIKNLPNLKPLKIINSIELKRNLSEFKKINVSSENKFFYNSLDKNNNKKEFSLDNKNNIPEEEIEEIRRKRLKIFKF